MGSADQIYVVLLVEGWYYFLTKSEGDTSVVFTPTLYIFVRVWPKEITEKTSVWDVCRSHNSLDLLETAQLWAEASMHAENLLVNNGSYWEAVKAVSKRLPQLDVVSSLAFVVESVNSVNGSALVIASKQEEVLRVLDFVGEQKTNGFQTLFASIYIVS